MDNAISKVKQPSPAISNELTGITQDAKYKIIPTGKIGVLKPSKITTTPIRDMIEIKRKENPYTKYKIHTKETSIKGFNTTASLAVIGCGILSLIKLFKK